MAEADLLRERLSGLSGRWFAVVDGAQFDDLPNALLEGDFVHRPLYLDRGDGNPNRLQTAPHLVWLDEIGLGERPRLRLQVVAALADLLRERPAAVFWRCSAGGDALYRHLRTINMAMVPRSHGEGDAGSADTDLDDGERGAPADPGLELVIFRHADANVMAQVIPALGARQYARLFGPAEEILFAPDEIWGGGIKRARRPDNAPPAPSGQLRLSPHNIRTIELARGAAANRRVALYLRKTLPPEINQQTDEDIAKQVDSAVSGAAAYGVSRHDALCRWSYLHMITGGAINSDPKIEAFMTSTKVNYTPDQRVRQIMQAMIFGMKRQA